jgi:hypothetical protein
MVEVVAELAAMDVLTLKQGMEVQVEAQERPHPQQLGEQVRHFRL